MVAATTVDCPEWLKRIIRTRDGRVCQYCGTTEAAHYVVEHVVPVERRGPHDPANLVMACAGCNVRKGDAIWLPRNFEQITQHAPADWVTWVRTQAVTSASDPTEPDKRMTFDVPEALHRRVKAGCAQRGVTIREVILQLLEAEFPNE